MSRDEPLVGKVAQIISERELAINLGERDGVSVGAKFAVLAATPLEIRDPDTDELLGVEDREKVRVQATKVEDRFSICATFNVRRIPAGFLAQVQALTDPLADAFQEEKVIPETLRTVDSSLPPPLDPAESFVKIGDRVIEVVDLDRLLGRY